MARIINQELQVFEVEKLNATCLKMDAKVADYSGALPNDYKLNMTL